VAWPREEVGRLCVCACVCVCVCVCVGVCERVYRRGVVGYVSAVKTVMVIRLPRLIDER
jgi:hypothetical protein